MALVWTSQKPSIRSPMSAFYWNSITSESVLSSPILDLRLPDGPHTASHPGTESKQYIQHYIWCSTGDGPRPSPFPVIHQRSPRHVSNIGNTCTSLCWWCPPVQANKIGRRCHRPQRWPYSHPDMGENMPDVIQSWQMRSAQSYQQKKKRLVLPVHHPWDCTPHRWWSQVPWSHHSKQPQLEASCKQHLQKGKQHQRILTKKPEEMQTQCLDWRR